MTEIHFPSNWDQDKCCEWIRQSNWIGQRGYSTIYRGWKNNQFWFNLVWKFIYDRS